MYFGAETPPREVPQGLWEGAHTARERPPGTHANDQRSKEVYNYTKYTVYRVQGTSILGPVYRVLGYIPSIQCTAYRVQGYRVVEWVMGNRVIGRG